MSVKILEKRKTATERVVVYEIGGERKAISRPSFVSFDELIAEIERLETSEARSDEKRADETSAPKAAATENVPASKSAAKKSSAGRKTEIKIEE